MSRRFGKGDFYVVTSGETEDDPTAEARHFFVGVALREIPELLTTFSQEVTPGLEALWGEFRDHPPGPLFDLTSTMLGLQLKPDHITTSIPIIPDDPGPPGNDMRVLWEALTQWSTRWHLSENRWFGLRVALRAYMTYAVREGLFGGDGPNPKLAAAIWLGHLADPKASALENKLAPANILRRAPLQLEDQIPPIVLPSWDPTAETWGEFRQRIESEVLPDEMTSYRARVESSTSIAPTPTKFDLHHFRWLARWQLLGETYATLFAREKQSESNLAKAVRRTAKLVGLKRRTETGPSLLP